MEKKVEIVQLPDIQLEVEKYGAGDKLIMLLHGFPECAHSWRNQIDMLVDLGYTVWVPNLRGYGNSSKPKGRKYYTSDYLAGDIKHLFETSGFDRMVLVGHDWGAQVAWMTAMYDLVPLDGLVIMNVPHPRNMMKGLQTFKQLKKSWYIFFFQLPFIPEFAIRYNQGRRFAKGLKMMYTNREAYTSEDREVYSRNYSIPGVSRGMVSYYRAIFYEMFKKGLSAVPKNKIMTKTLMIWGEKDMALGKELTYGTDKYVDQFELHYLPKAGHFVQQDAPEEVNAILKHWLEAL